MNKNEQKKKSFHRVILLLVLTLLIAGICVLVLTIISSSTTDYYLPREGSHFDDGKYDEKPDKVKPNGDNLKDDSNFRNDKPEDNNLPLVTTITVSV